MLQLHPNFLIKDGKKEFAVIPYEEYEALEALLADFEDLVALREAKKAEQDEPPTSLEDVMQKYGVSAK